MKRVRVGVVGAGYWGPNVIRTFASLPDCDVAYVCDRRPGRLQYLAERFPELRATQHYEDLLADRDLDAVAIVTPPSTHRFLAEAALAAGKHVFVEKPLAPNARDAEMIAEAAERAHRVLATGHVFVYHPAVAVLRSWAHSGDVGELCYAESDRVNLGPPASEVDVVWDLAVHDVSMLLSIVGDEPVDVEADGRRYLHPTLTDVAFLTLRFRSGFLAKLHVSWLSPVKTRRLFLAGTEGTAIFDDTRPVDKLLLSDRGVDTRIGADDGTARDLLYRPGEVRAFPLPETLPLTSECAHFLDCVRTGLRPEVDGRAGLAVVRVLEAATRSIAQAGRPVRVEDITSRSTVAVS